MLNSALNILVKKLNLYIAPRIHFEEGDIVKLAPPVSPDGVNPVEANNKLLVFLANISKDTLPQQSGFSTAGAQRTKNLYLNLYVVVAANFHSQQYSNALVCLSHAISCFQKNAVIDKNNYTDMPDGIEKLIIDIENTAVNEASNLWGILGGKYLPSVFYKVRMLCVSSDAVTERLPMASKPEHSVG